MAFYCIHCRSAIDPAFRACPYCGEPMTDFLRRHLGEPVDGKYQILSRLAIGGMAEVYKALHVHLNSMRVIKLMRPNVAEDPGAHDRFLREARLATKIAHPNVAALYDFSTLEDGSHYMVWEYIEGTNLLERLAASGPLAPRYAAGLAIQALSGLDAIHRAGVVHRDVSPENVMITRDDEGDERVKIIDLGIARATGGDDTNTQRGQFLGKWKYCSPEHLGVLPPGGRIDARADLYSFGVVLFEMLTGVPPFRAATPHDYVILHSSQSPPALAEANPSIPPVPELERLIRRALEKDRDERFASAREFAQEIERILPLLPDDAGASRIDPERAEATVRETDPEAMPGRGPRAAPVPPPRRNQTPGAKPGRRGAWLVAAALVLAALGIAGVLLTRSGDSPPEAPPRAAAPAPRVPVPGHVGINAFPWAEVRTIRSLGDGKVTRMPPGSWTPMSVDLAPGAWEITLENPSYRDPISRTVVVAEGSEQIVTLHFADPARAPFPDFGGRR